MHSKFVLVLKILLPSLLTCQVDSGLVAKYTFNKGTAENEAGSFNAIVRGGAYTEDRFGNSASAYFLTGNYTDYISLGTSNRVKPQKGTFSLWVNVQQPVYSGYGVDQNPIVYTLSHSGDDCNEAFFIGYHLTLRKFNISTSLREGMQVAIYPEGTAYLRRWYHLAMTYDKNFLSFYIDGVLQGKTIKNFDSEFLAGDSVTVGNRTSRRNNRYFQGCIDDIQVFNRVLSPAEVLQLYNAPNPNKAKTILRWILLILAVAGIIFLIALYIKYRINKVLQAEKEKNELRNRWYEQENKVLSAQMDPHFIFNSLNTIQQFIITNENEKAQLYLSKFSRLIRKILETNTRESITLEEEIEIFEKYLEIESLRFNNVFTYSIHVDEGIEPDKISIPHFLLQPLIENAIWHGLLPKEGEKRLRIAFKRVDENLLSCTIEDNGVGRKAAVRISASEKKSLAINFIEQRLSLLSKVHKVDCHIKIIDKVDEQSRSAGTTIIVTIPVLGKK